VLRARVPLELVRALELLRLLELPREPEPLRFVELPPDELRVLRFAPLELARASEPDLLDPPLLACGMVPP
jgi:hypothetical protein